MNTGKSLKTYFLDYHHFFVESGGCLKVLKLTSVALKTTFGVACPQAAMWAMLQNKYPSVKTLETLAKILHILTYSCLLLKVLIRSCLFLLRTNLLNFLIVFLVRVLSRVSREWISCKTNFAVVRTTSYTIIL